MTEHKNRILLTGATGFLGQNFARYLKDKPQYPLKAVVRAVPFAGMECFAEYCQIDTIDGRTNWQQALTACDVVVHAAARVHVMREQATDPLQAFRQINVEGSLNLARQAAAQGIRRFIFISSIKVNGERTDPGKPFRVEVEQIPTDPYGLSKYEAEEGLRNIARDTAMDVVIIRLPLIYGPGVKGNFQRLVALLQKGYPLPLRSCQNKRSFVAVDNVCHLLERCLTHAAAANGTFLVSDGVDLSSAELIEKMAKTMQSKARLFACPESWLRCCGKILGKEQEVSRLLDSLQIDLSQTKTILDWHPPVSVEEALHKMIHGTN
ncbi:MAG: SDR family oxidoreductase [Legionellaceae bacterium]|nr:SDR family oxidoreductase [Legionellaceae bacterium]